MAAIAPILAQAYGQPQCPCKLVRVVWEFIGLKPGEPDKLKLAPRYNFIDNCIRFRGRSMAMTRTVTSWCRVTTSEGLFT
jgi:hypothetical protein